MKLRINILPEKSYQLRNNTYSTPQSVELVFFKKKSFSVIAAHFTYCHTKTGDFRGLLLSFTVRQYMNGGKATGFEMKFYEISNEDIFVLKYTIM